MGETAMSHSIDRSDRPGHAGLVLVLALALIGAVAGIVLAPPDMTEAVILALLALFAIVGIAGLFSYATGFLQRASHRPAESLGGAIADTSADGMAIVKSNGRVAYANAAYRIQAGLAPRAGEAPEALESIPAAERLFAGAPEAEEAIYRLAQAARDGRSASEEIRMSVPLAGRRQIGGISASAGAHPPAGAYIPAGAWYEVSVRPLSAGAGRHGQMTLWRVSDITHDRERQENVFQELQHAIDYLDHAPAGFLSLTTDGKIVYMNATLAGWLDHDLAQVGSGGLMLDEVLLPSAAALIGAVTGKPGETRTEILDIDLRKRGGQSLPVRLFHRVTFSPEGVPAPSRTLVLNRSPGEDADEGQRAAEVRFSRFFNNTPVAIATVNATGGILRSNASFADLFGAGDGQSLRSILEAVAPENRDALAAAIRDAASGLGNILPVNVSVSGQNKSARFYFSGVDDDTGDGERAIVYALDTTGQRELEEQFAQSQKMQAIGQLAGGVAHDFNNVLQAISGFSELLLANHRPTDPSFQDIMQIKQNANRAASLVRQLLAFSRRQTLLPKVLQLEDEISELSHMLKRVLGERIQLDQRYSPDLWSVRADSTQLGQVIINLAVNARDAMTDGGKLTIRTANLTETDCVRYRASMGALPEGDYVLIEVTDTGTGIPPEILDKIFDPFFTTKDTGKGTGLGLSTVYGIIQQTGGHIFCDSTVGAGTTFRIFLPRYVATEQPVVAKEESKPVDAPDLTGRGTVLLVEDEEGVRKFAARALTARGYTVIEASSGLEALALTEQHDIAIDVVVSDVVMPGMDGPTLLVELRRRYPALKVIFVSGYAEDAFARHLPEGEQFSFLPKPFSLKELSETVKGIIG